MSTADWSWLSGREDELRAMSPDAASEAITSALAAVDERIGAEVSDDSGTRTVVVTAGGEVEAFAVVRRVVESAPSVAGWSFVAFRPARGFEFQVDAGGMVFEAKALSFMPLRPDEAPSQPAIRLLVPNPGLEAWAEIGLQIIEAGVGEEAAARIAYLEIGARDDDSHDVYGLESLGGYLERNTKPADAR
ncbi:MAG: hypothetical protein AAF799_41595 [Myxococcota bacterium]